jgi:hypothetical protein
MSLHIHSADHKDTTTIQSSVNFIRQLHNDNHKECSCSDIEHLQTKEEEDDDINSPQLTFGALFLPMFWNPIFCLQHCWLLTVMF